MYDDEVEIINSLASRITANKTVMRVLDSKGFDVASEELEEVLSKLLDPMAEMLVMGKAVAKCILSTKKQLRQAYRHWL